MKRSLLLVLLFSFLTVGALSSQANWAVNPGDGVGAVTLGMTSGAANSILVPSRRFGSERNPEIIEYGNELIIEYEGNKAVVISLHSNSFQTKNGVVAWVPYKGAKIGGTWSSVASQLPNQKMSHALPTAKGYPKEDYHAYRSLGLGFRVKGGTIVQIDVWKSN